MIVTILCALLCGVSLMQANVYSDLAEDAKHDADRFGTGSNEHAVMFLAECNRACQNSKNWALVFSAATVLAGFVWALS